MSLRLLITCALLIPGCSLWYDEVNETFGWQHLTTAVAHIETHRVRNGEYPESLDELEYLGDWDHLHIDNVRYQRTETGYTLHIERGYLSEPALEVREDFRTNLGLENVNVTWIPSTPTATPTSHP